MSGRAAWNFSRAEQFMRSYIGADVKIYTSPAFESNNAASVRG
jgi:hypothetical protein